jgi:SAM-dependent methyltransferase
MICPVCRGWLVTSEREVFDTRFGLDETYDIAACNDCRIEVTLPVGGPPNLAALYESFYNFGGERDTLYTKIRDAALSSSAYRVWLRLDGDISFYLRRGRGRLLDIGCNEGRPLEHYRRNGWDVEGVELNTKAAEVARGRGFTVHTVPLADLELEHQFDVVVLSNVIEHVADAGELLGHCHRLLKPGGELWISCPNNASWLRRAFGRYWINWHVPFHLFHFSSATLLKLLEARGFEIIETRQATPALWVAQSAIARMFARRGRPTRALRNVFLIAPALPLIRAVMAPLLGFANRLGHGDCLMVVARR